MSTVRFINCFEVPTGREDEFFALFREVNAYMRTKPGYVSHRLHRSLTPDARFRFVNLVHWESAERFAAAHDDGFQQLVSKPEWAAFTSTHALYEIIHEGHASSTADRSPAT